MMRSLRLKILLAMVLVTIAGVVITALNATRSTTGEFKQYVAHGQSMRQRRYSVLLTEFYAKSQTWDGVQPLVNQLQAMAGERIVLTDSNWIVVGDSENSSIGNTAGTDWDYKITGLGGSTAGYLYINPITDTELSTSAYLLNISRSVWVGALIAIVIASITTLLVSRSILNPIEELTVAAQKMQKGDLSVRVNVETGDEVGQLGTSFNAMADSLVAQEQLRKNMVSDVAHELRTPLSNIRGYLEAARDGLIKPDLDLVNNLYDEASLLNRLIDDLQDLAQVESGHLQLEKTEENLDEIILSTVENYIPICRKQDLDLSYDISAGLPTMNVDAKRIAQILRNLLSNAIDYTPPGGKIVIKAEIEDHFIRVVVKDTGSGIAPEHIPYIFERFYRADSSRTRSTGGSGLGLSIVKQLVQAHGGQVGVDSTPGSGSDFFFTVPVSPK